MTTQPKIKFETFGTPRKFKDVPVGGIFRAYAQGKFVRFIKAVDDDGDAELLITIGPFYDEDGPALFRTSSFSISDNTLCLDETGSIALRPSEDEPGIENAPHRHGNLIVTADDNYLFMDLNPATPRDKVLFSLGSARIVRRSSLHNRIVFDRYVLVRAKSEHVVAYEWPRAAIDKSRAA